VKSTLEGITQAFAKALSSHGHGFQYAVLDHISSLSASQKSFWMPWVPEFPVQVQSSGTRIDLILRHRTRPYYLICECKRANPALANWCFARAIQAHGPSYTSRTYIETINYHPVKPQAGLQDLVESSRIYQVALEIRSNAKGEEFSKGRGEIEDAATQVCRGMNGLIEFIASRQDQMLKDDGYAAFIPAIITTARVLSTEANVASAEMETGQVEGLAPPLQESDWLWYEYPQSPGLKHSFPFRERTTDLRKIIYQEFIRRIAVISTSGLANFLAMNVWFP
jgi:hypothetical protein